MDVYGGDAIDVGPVDLAAELSAVFTQLELRNTYGLGADRRQLLAARQRGCEVALRGATTARAAHSGASTTEL